MVVKDRSANLSDVRKTNCKLIFEILDRNNGITLSDLEQKAGLSRPTTVSMVRALEDARIVIPVGKKTSNGGRTPFLYGVNPDAFYAVGIDFEFPISRIAVGDAKGGIKYSTEITFPPNLSHDKVMERLLQQINEVIDNSGIEKSRLLGIGMGMPGYINIKSGMSLHFERIAGWKNIEIGRYISEHIGIPVYMENDVHLLFRAERELWNLDNDQDALFIAIRSGIGMAIFQRGHIIEGEYGNAGHIGHTVIQAGGPRCKCGNRGCLELYASETAIDRNYETLTGQRTVPVTEIVQRANGGETEAKTVLSEAGHYLGIGIGNAVNLFDINTVIVSSYFDNTFILEGAQQELDQCINLTRESKARIYPSRLTSEKYTLGGCKLVFQRSQQKILETVQLKNI